MKFYTLLIILIINSLQVLGQQKTKVVLKNDTSFEGQILRYDDKEVKLIEKGMLYIIPRENILSPKEIKLKTSFVYTIIETENGHLVSGKMINETDNTITVRMNFNSEIINKTAIVYQAYYVKKYYEETESFIKTKDGNLFVGDVLKNHNGMTLIDIGNGMKQEIDNELIISNIEKRKSKKSTGKTLAYFTLALLGVLFIVN